MSDHRIPPFYKRYIDLVDTRLLIHSLQVNGEEMYQFVRTWTDEMTDYRYADNKWSAREVIMHMIDAERIFAYRALRIARMDQTELPGFDENSYALTYAEDKRLFHEILEEMRIVRASSIALFKGFEDIHLKRSGMASGVQFTVRNIGEVIVGHEQHHKNILIERYFPEKV